MIFAQFKAEVGQCSKHSSTNVLDFNRRSLNSVYFRNLSLLPWKQSFTPILGTEKTIIEIQLKKSSINLYIGNTSSYMNV